MLTNFSSLTMVDVNSRLKSTEMTIRRRVECEERAFHIVNKLIDGYVDGAYLSECGKRISPGNYDDIVEERAISMLCGYPVCDQNLPNVPKKKYHISTKTNKVYDISERKNFCSNQCFKASKIFQQQIPESPVWTREEGEDDVNIVVSPHKAVPGLVGDEVIGEIPKSDLQKEIEELENMDKKYTTNKQDTILRTVGDSVDNVSEDQWYNLKTLKDAMIIPDVVCKDSNKSSVLPENMLSFDDIHRNLAGLSLEGSETRESIPESCPMDESDEVEHISTEQSISHGESITKVKTGNKDIDSKSLSKMDQLQKLLNQKKKVLSGMVDLQETSMIKSAEIQLEQKSDFAVSKIEKVAIDVSKDTSQYVQKDLNRSEKSPCKKKTTAAPPISPLQLICQILKTWVSSKTVQYLRLEHSQTESAESTSGVSSNLQNKVDYVNLCKKLDQQEKQLSNVLEDGITSADLSVITDNADRPEKELKNVPDYKKLREETELFQLKVTEYITGKRPKRESKKQDDAVEKDVYIPTVDAYDQSQIRAKIVLERLDRSLPDLLVPMGLAVQDVSCAIRELVYTFRLEKDTIIFKPAEWTLVSLLLLKMLSFKVKYLSKAFEKDSAIRHFNVLLTSIKHNMEDLESYTRDMLANIISKDELD